MENIDKRLERLAEKVDNLAELYRRYPGRRTYEGTVIIEIKPNLSVRQYLELCDYLIQYSIIEAVWKEDKTGKVFGWDKPSAIIDCSGEEEDKIREDWEKNKDKAPFKYIENIIRVNYDGGFQQMI